MFTHRSYTAHTLAVALLVGAYTILGLDSIDIGFLGSIFDPYTFISKILGYIPPLLVLASGTWNGAEHRSELSRCLRTGYLIGLGFVVISTTWVIGWSSAAIAVAAICFGYSLIAFLIAWLLSGIGMGLATVLLVFSSEGQ